jgi:uncharacterized membrane protein YdbT with pleckstrin-like domain
MKFIASILGADEKVVKVAGFHWSYDLMLGLVLAVAAAPAIALTVWRLSEPWYWGGAGLWALWFLFRFLKLLLEKFTTERAVTDRRVIVKTGIIARHSSELPLERIDEVYLRQSVLGRLFGYGTVLVSGMGGSEKIAFAGIDDPVEFHRAIGAAKAQARAPAR